MKLYIAVALTLVILFSGCAGMNKAQSGAIGGAAGGAVLGQIIGGDTEATLIGAAVGTMLGYIVGNEMDKHDKQQLNRIYETGVSNQGSSWVNPDTGNQYVVTPEPAYQNSTNQVCREAEIEAVIDGQRQLTNATACRDASGQWRLR